VKAIYFSGKAVMGFVVTLPILRVVLCQDKSETLVEITLPENNDQIFASRYQTVLPDKQVFINLLNQSRG
jgi:hypothetical protein